MSIPRVSIKVCGITNAADAFAAIAAGADMLGFNFYERSRRAISVEVAAGIIRRLRDSDIDADCVGIFVNANGDAIRAAVEEAGIDAVQLHGNEGPEQCEMLRPLRVIKALRVHAGFDPAIVSNFDCDTILLDAWNANEAGGTGETFDWSIAAEIRRRVKRLILAGGLDATNVAEAIQHVRPNAVDVCSGVEDRPGQKSAARMRAFVDAVRQADSATTTLARSN